MLEFPHPETQNALFQVLLSQQMAWRKEFNILNKHNSSFLNFSQNQQYIHTIIHKYNITIIWQTYLWRDLPYLSTGEVWQFSVLSSWWWSWSWPSLHMLKGPRAGIYRTWFVWLWSFWFVLVRRLTWYWRASLPRSVSTGVYSIV